MHKIQVYDRNTGNIKSAKTEEIDELVNNDNYLLWIDFQNPAGQWPNELELRILQDNLKIHYLIIEDCVVARHFPKVEESQNYTFLIFSMFKIDENNNIKTNKICFILGKNYIITYSHCEIEEIAYVSGILKSIPNDPAEIFYNIIDRIIDSYIPLIDSFDLDLDKIENILFRRPDNPKVIRLVNKLRNNLNTIRRNLVIEKDIFYDLVKGYHPLIEGKNVYFRDIFDHIVKVLDILENQKEEVANVLNIQLNLNTQKLNQLIKFLTIISASLLPASLIAGIFGMNFDYLPLVDLKYGFLIITAAMISLGLLIVLFFKTRKWI